MKNLLWFCTALALFYIPFAAEAQFPKPRPATAPQVAQTEVQAPSPAVIQAAPPVVNVAAPAVTVTPQLLAPAASTLDQIRTWLNTIFGGLIAGFLAKIGFGGIKTAAPSVGGQPAVVADVLAKLSDPAVKQSLEAHGLQIALGAVQSGIPGLAIQSGVSLIPGAGPAIAALEPTIRGLGIKALQDLIAKQATVAVP